jgi:hypothetical protein
MTVHRVLLWLFRALYIALLVWVCYDRQHHTVDWLLLVACICFFILGAWTYERTKQWRAKR